MNSNCLLWKWSKITCVSIPSFELSFRFMVWGAETCDHILPNLVSIIQIRYDAWELPKIDRPMSKQLSMSAFVLITFNLKSSKGLGSPSPSTPKVVYKPPSGFETNKIKSLKVGVYGKSSLTSCDHLSFHV